MILGAGLGLRMRPLTLLRAKPALPVMNRPLIQWTLELLARHGVTDVVVNLHHLPRTIAAAVGDGRALGLRVTYSHERRILGTAGGPRRVRKWLGDGPVLLVNGDVVFDFDLGRLVARHVEAGVRATLALRPNPDPRRYGPVVTGPSGRIRSLAGLPRKAPGQVSLFTGIHVLDPALLDRLAPGPSDSVRDLYAPLVAEGERLLGVRVRGAWYDFGSPSAYLASQVAMLKAGFGSLGPHASLVDATARVAPGAHVSASVVGPGAVVEEGARLVRSVVWDRVVVGRRAVVRDSIVAASLRSGAEVRGRAIVRGRRVRLT